MICASKLRCRTIALVLPFVLALAFQASQASGVERIFTIDPDQSSIAISGSVRSSVGTSQIEAQGPGSLTTSYSGTIRTDRGNNSVQFLPGSSIDASISGNWRPLSTGAAGSAAADYGGRVSFLFGLVTINFAARDFVGDLSSGALPLDASGDFSLSTTTVRFLDGNLAYRASADDAGSESIVGESGMMSGTGSLITETRSNGTFEILSIPIDSSFEIPVGESTTVNLRLSGEVLATAMLQDSLPGDFNTNGIVDAADYAAWRNGVGTIFTQDDYQTWRANFGRTSLNGPLSSSQAVPEPSNIVVICCLAVAGIRRRRSCIESSWRTVCHCSRCCNGPCHLLRKRVNSLHSHTLTASSEEPGFKANRCTLTMAH